MSTASSTRYARFHTIPSSDQRSPSQRDRDRLLYSAEFRRLAGITQVIGPTDQFLVHSRLTHTLEVAQIARRLAEYLRQDGAYEEIEAQSIEIDPDIAEAAALAHDLGHPPRLAISQKMNLIAFPRNTIWAKASMGMPSHSGLSPNWRCGLRMSPDST